MYSALGDAALPAPGFPIRRSTGQRLFSASPWLIAAVHVLHRLLVPRHPPRALSILTVILDNSMFWPTVQFSRSGEKRGNGPEAARSLKTKQHADRQPRRSRDGLVATSRSGRHFGTRPRARGPRYADPKPTRPRACPRTAGRS